MTQMTRTCLPSQGQSQGASQGPDLNGVAEAAAKLATEVLPAPINGIVDTIAKPVRAQKKEDENTDGWTEQLLKGLAPCSITDVAFMDSFKIEAIYCAELYTEEESLNKLAQDIAKITTVDAWLACQTEIESGIHKKLAGTCDELGNVMTIIAEHLSKQEHQSFLNALMCNDEHKAKKAKQVQDNMQIFCAVASSIESHRPQSLTSELQDVALSLPVLQKLTGRSPEFAVASQSGQQREASHDEPDADRQAQEAASGQPVELVGAPQTCTSFEQLKIEFEQKLRTELQKGVPGGPNYEVVLKLRNEAVHKQIQLTNERDQKRICEAEAQALRSSVSDLEAKLANATSTAQALQQQLAAQTSATSEMEKKKVQMTKITLGHDEEISTLKKQVADFDKFSEMSQSKLKQAEEQISELQNKVNDSEKKLAECQSKLNHSEDQVSAMQRKATEAEAIHEKCRNDLAETRAKLQSCTAPSTK